MGNKPWTDAELSVLNSEHTKEELIKLLPGRSWNAIRLKKEELGITNKKTSPTIESDIAEMHNKIEERDVKKKNEEYLKRIHAQSKTIESYLAIKNGVETYSIKASKELKSEATAVILYGDWHADEEVLPKKIQGLNKFNLEIAKQRAESSFVNAVRLINITKKDTDINNIVIGLLGDFFSGSIHEELLEQNQLGPMDAVLFVQKLLISGVEYMLKNTTCNLTIPCVVGNHSRITEKTRMTMENEHSLEYLMYHNIAQYFEKEERVKFVISDGDVLYIDVYNKKLRFIHGHQIKFGGGVGGVTIPLLKYIQRQDQIIKADYTCLGHYHNFKDGGNFIMNGCLIGYNAYAQRFGASFETPRQAFFLIDKSRGKTIVAPIFTE